MRILSLISLFAVTGCTQVSPPKQPAAEKPVLELVESVPSGAIADDPSIPDTDEVWRAMISGARKSVSIEQFYISEKPPEQPGRDRLQPVLAELEAAARRGVNVRVIVDAMFGKKYPASLDRLRAHGVALRLYDVKSLMGGVQHAKMVIADGDVYFGSANFDWRSLDHIFELGLHLKSDRAVRFYQAIFDADWQAADGHPPAWFGHPPIDQDSGECQSAGDPTPQPIPGDRVIAVASPRWFLPDCECWDLTWMVRAIDAARRELRIEVLDFETKNRDGTPFETLAQALERAAIRGVKVRLVVSSWQKSPRKIGAVQELARVPGIDVRIVTIPEAASGHIDFARVIHAKYMVADDDLVWVGSSNWGGDYFLHSRNVGAMVRSPALAAQLKRVFDRLAASPMAEIVPGPAAQ